jgi:hypothetical protein
MASTEHDTREQRIRTRFTREVDRRDAGRADVEAANAELGKLFAEAIDSELGILKDLAEEAGVSRPTAYAMAKHPVTAKQEEGR